MNIDISTIKDIRIDYSIDRSLYIRCRDIGNSDFVTALMSRGFVYGAGAYRGEVYACRLWQ